MQSGVAQDNSFNSVLVLFLSAAILSAAVARRTGRWARPAILENSIVYATGRECSIRASYSIGHVHYGAYRVGDGGRTEFTADCRRDADALFAFGAGESRAGTPDSGLCGGPA